MVAPDYLGLGTGLSQGGPAAMSLGRALQKDGRLGAVAGISGFYDLFGTQFPDALDGKVTPSDLLTDWAIGQLRDPIKKLRAGTDGSQHLGQARLPADH